MHQCGRCKEVFRNLQLYLTHKASKACKHSAKAQAARKSVSEEPQEAPTELTEPEPANSGDSEVPQENILEAAAKDTIYKQLQILVVDPDHADQQQVQTVLTEGQSNEAPVAFVAVQDETGQTVTVKAEELLPLNRPLMFGDSPSKKGMVVLG